MLTSAQMADVRRFTGYPLVGTTMTINNNQDITYVFFGMLVMSYYTRLTTLTADEEAIIINTYLTNLYTLETAIVSSGADLDTDVAAVWTRNKQEVADRTDLFDLWRRRLCGFIGIAPGPGLGNGMLSVARA